MTKHREFSNSDDTIDSRDVISRIADLESEIDDLQSDLSDFESQDGGVITDSDIEQVNKIRSSIEELQYELEPLQALEDEASGSPDWEYGETLIRDSYFEDYAQQLAEDIGAINEDAHWPNDCIDWERAADELKMDYMSVDFDGVDYWIRA